MKNSKYSALKYNMDPFVDGGGAEILEGFLCPICKADLKTPDRLTAHFETDHTDDQDILRSFKDILMTAKKKMRVFDDIVPASAIISDNSQKFHQAAVNPFDDRRPQECGTDVNHMAYFRAIRTPRLERYATETNKLIIRLHKLLTDRPSDSIQQKQHEQSVRRETRATRLINLFINFCSDSSMVRWQIGEIMSELYEKI